MLSILNTKQFAEMDHDPTAYIEGKVQRILRKIKNKLPSFVYSKIYLSRPLPGKFYGTAKLHKVSNNGTVDQLPPRPIISNIGMATYEIANYLTQLLKQLSDSHYTIKNGKTFTKRFKEMKIRPEYKIVSFEIVSFFTNVPYIPYKTKQKEESYCISAIKMHTLSAFS